MKELLLQYARYNAWANNLIIESMLLLPAGGVDKEIVSSFLSIRKTVHHVWGAEDIWLQRLNKVANPIWVAGNFEGPFEEACNNWQHASAQLLQYTQSTDDTSLHSILPYHDVKGNPYQRHIWQVLQHVFNHSTYHRGQLVTMLRQAGATIIPGTDFTLFMNIK